MILTGTRVTFAPGFLISCNMKRAVLILLAALVCGVCIYFVTMPKEASNVEKCDVPIEYRAFCIPSTLNYHDNMHKR